MSALDWILVAWVALWALLGAARGMTEQLLSLAGLAVGAAAGSRLAPLLLPDGRESVWLPLVALGTAIAGALIVQAILLRLAAPLRRRGRSATRCGGWTRAAGCWWAPRSASRSPGSRAPSPSTSPATARPASARRSSAPASSRPPCGPSLPDHLLGALARIDPFPVIPLPAEALPPPDESVLRDPVALRARGSVVQVRGRACGLVKQGSGWVVGDDLVATNAHVIAGQDDTLLIAPGGPSLAAEPVFVDARNDVALLRVPGLGLRAPAAWPTPPAPPSRSC